MGTPKNGSLAAEINAFYQSAKFDTTEGLCKRITEHFVKNGVIERTKYKLCELFSSYYNAGVIQENNEPACKAIEINDCGKKVALCIISDAQYEGGHYIYDVYSQMKNLESTMASSLKNKKYYHSFN